MGRWSDSNTLTTTLVPRLSKSGRYRAVTVPGHSRPAVGGTVTATPQAFRRMLGDKDGDLEGRRPVALRLGATVQPSPASGCRC